MTKVLTHVPTRLELAERHFPQFAALERNTLVSRARSVHPSGVPMSGGAEPAGAAKHPERDALR